MRFNKINKISYNSINIMECSECDIPMVIVSAEYVCPNCLNSYNIMIEPLDNFELCCGNKTIEVDTNRSCMTCGRSKMCLIYEEDHYKSDNKLSLYKRYKYFLEKLNLLSGRKMSQSPKCSQLIKILKPEDFNNVIELRHLMKKHGYSKLNKFIYNIYYEIKGERLIDFTAQEKNKLCQDFLNIEKVFKKSDSRKNIYNYNLMIMLLMKKNNIKGHQYLILPKNRKQIKPLISVLLE